MLAFTWLNGNLCTIQMTDWTCWDKPFWIQRGEPYQKGYLEEWEKVDVEQNCDSGKDKSCLTAIFAEPERERKAHEDERTTTRAPPRDCSSLGGGWLVQGPMKALYLGDLFELSHPRKLAPATLTPPKQFGTLPN